MFGTRFTVIKKAWIRMLDSCPLVAYTTTASATETAMADIVSGPSLLLTSNISRPRPSMLHILGLRSLPYWTQIKNNQNIVAYGDPSITAVVEYLDTHWEKIWNEYKDVASSLSSDYQTDTEHHTLHEGKWDWHSYMTKGVVSDRTPFHQKFPITTSILNKLRSTSDDNSSSACSNQLFEGTPFGYAFFSTLHNNSNIKAHTATMNFRLRIHLPLSVPTQSSDSNSINYRPACGIRVGNVIREWSTGKSLVLDDSYDHEVWNDTDERRVLLLIDVWHPDVTIQERKEIINMFQAAKDKGWLS